MYISVSDHYGSTGAAGYGTSSTGGNSYYDQHRTTPYGPPQVVDYPGYNPYTTSYSVHEQNGLDWGQNSYGGGYDHFAGKVISLLLFLYII